MAGVLIRIHGALAFVRAWYPGLHPAMCLRVRKFHTRALPLVFPVTALAIYIFRGRVLGYTCIQVSAWGHSGFCVKKQTNPGYSPDTVPRFVPCLVITSK